MRKFFALLLIPFAAACTRPKTELDVVEVPIPEVQPVRAINAFSGPSGLFCTSISRPDEEMVLTAFRQIGNPIQVHQILTGRYGEQVAVECYQTIIRDLFNRVESQQVLEQPVTFPVFTKASSNLE